MIADIHAVKAALLAADLAAATPARLKAVGGLATMLMAYDEDIRQLAFRATDIATQRFAEATADDGRETEREAWLDALLHFTPEDYVFSDIIDDNQFETLQAARCAVEAKWQADIRPLLEGDATAQATHPLTERLRRLLLFYQNDINQLAQGDDARARMILSTADSCFAQCREDIFGTEAGDSRFALHFAPYYEVLCHAHPSHRLPSHVHFYKEYFRHFRSLGERLAADPTRLWQYREVLWHHRLQGERRYDQSLPWRLSLGESTAMQQFRQQCSMWMFDQDPDDDYSIQYEADRQQFVSKGKEALRSWLAAKVSNGVPIPREREAEALQTLHCAESLLNAEFTLQTAS